MVRTGTGKFPGSETDGCVRINHASVRYIDIHLPAVLADCLLFSMLFIMSRFIVPRIADILEQRQRKIDGYLNKAHNIRLEAEESLKNIRTP